MIEVDLPDGSVAEFPDGTTPDIIKGALRKRFGAAQQPSAMGEMSAMTSRFDAGPEEVRRNMPDERSNPIGKVDAAVRGLADVFTLGGADEIAAGLGTGFGYLGDYDAELARQRGTDAADAEKRGGYRLGGQIAGALAGGAGLAKSGLSLTGRAVDAGYRLPMVAGASAVEGGALGAASGFGSGEGIEDRLNSAKTGAKWGAGLGGIAPFATAGIAKGAEKVMSGRALSQAAKGAPSQADVKGKADKLYDFLRRAGISYDPAAYGDSIENARAQMMKAGLRPANAGEAFAYLDDLKGTGAAPDFDDINSLVQTVGEMQRGYARAPDKAPLAKGYSIIRDALDDFEMNAPMTSKAGISMDTMNKTRQAARQTALKNIKSRTLANITKDAETYQSGLEAGIRNGIGNLLRSGRGKQLFSNEAERKALLEVAQGRKGLRTLSKFGLDLTSLGGNAAFLPTLGALATGSMGGPLAGGALVAAGTVAKSISPRMTQAGLEKVAAVIRAGKLNPETVMKRLPTSQRKALNSMLTAGGASAAGRF